MELTDNTEKKQFEFVVDGHTARIEYILSSKKIILTHTEVPKELEGKGIGGKIVKLALENIESRGLKLIPLCSFVAAYVKRHPEWSRVLDEEVNLK
ncbi:MAG: N-acetyltransferase [Ignavibacteria bacterium]|nr:N-acetyltransferase [Ignavibacteria bacterium]